MGIQWPKGRARAREKPAVRGLKKKQNQCRDKLRQNTEHVVSVILALCPCPGAVNKLAILFHFSSPVSGIFVVAIGELSFNC